MTTVIALHGYGSSPSSSSTIKTLKNGLKEYSFISPKYDEKDPSGTAGKLLSMATSVPENEELVIIGASLGGFWARWLANKVRGAKLVLINPSINAPENLKKYVASGGLASSEVDAYKPYKISTDRSSMSIMVIVAMDDDVVSPKETVSLYNGRAEVHKGTGGHRMSTLNTYIDSIKKFIETSVE